METYEWDMAKNINTKDEVYAYLQGAIEENNIETLLDVIGAIARSKGMKIIAKELGLTIIKVLDLLGYRMQIIPKNNIKIPA